MTLSPKCGRVSYCLLVLLLVFGLLPIAQAQLSLPLTEGCGWPFKTTPDTLNVMYPDSNAIYWTTPFITLPGSKLTIEGKFIPARFLSINTYNTLGESINSVYDVNFPLDNGSQNPFTTETATGGSFHVLIEPEPKNPPVQKPSDVLYGPPINQYGFSQGYVVIRAYIPTNDIKQRELPNITISLNGFRLATVKPCTTLSNSLRLLLYNALIRFWDGNYNAPGATDPTDAPMFRPPSSMQAGGAFPNDFNKYVVTGITYQKGRLAIIHGKAPIVPPLQTTSAGYPVLSTPTPQNLRYWSLCNYDYVFPYPVVKDNGCAYDNQVPITDGYYTFVVAAKADIPTYQDPEVKLLNWGVTAIQKALIFRNMLPVNGFSQTAQAANADPNCTTGDVPTDAQCTKNIMGDYYPNAVYCSKSVYEQGGWKACYQVAQKSNKE